MNNTAANILKILSQSEMSIEDMHLYLKVEKSSILKTITQINEFLVSLNLPVIKKEDDRFNLSLSKDEWKTLFKNFKVLTSEEKIDYLYIKFIANGFLNLEKEKEILDLSRSTILRCFQTVKEMFSKNGSKYEYLHAKGLSLTELSEHDKHLFYKKVMKLFIEEDILVPPLKTLLKSLKKFDTKVRLSQLYPILRFSKISINYFLLSFICSLEVCTELFDGLNFQKEKYRDTLEFKNFMLYINKYGKDFTPKYREELGFFLCALNKKDNILEDNLRDKTSTFLNILKEEFGIKFLNDDLERMLFSKIYLSFFKFENKILKLKSVKFDRTQKILLNKLEAILHEYSSDMYLVDKFAVIFVLRRALIEENFNNVKNVLLLFNEVGASDHIVFKKSLTKLVPHVNFELEATFFHKKNVLTKYEKYDLIISDEKINSEVIVIDFYSSIKVHDIIEKKAFEIGINKLQKIDNTIKFV
ncbi:hypothetical protein [Cetobacterium sp.]|uniref:hypothetical protein n=1 Tax=Cetobacterium sp. TaxID=2071632 RepID=UPI003F3BA019